ncbi:lysophospholipase [Calidifontibacter terrae]
MRSDTFLLDTHDSTPVFVRRWLPNGEPHSVVQIAHGMAEHSGRYARFAEALTNAGYTVYADDHRGHGETAPDRKDVGYFADQNGWDAVADDLHVLTDQIHSNHPGLPVVLFGHSMGSFLSRTYATRWSGDISALVLCGTAGPAGPLGVVGKGIAKAQAKLRGARHTSGLMNTLTFGQYNSAFKPNRTDFDWLSRDPAEVDKYIADPHCGNVFTAGFYADMIGGLQHANSAEEMKKIRRDLPILVISGSKDPVGANGKGVEAVAAALRTAGVTDVTLTLYPDARHELLNETNRDEVTADVLRWMGTHLTVVAP